MKILVLLFLLFLSFFGFSQQTEYVDFKTAEADIIFSNLVKKEIKGLIIYQFKILKNVDSIFIDANNFNEIEYILDGNITGKTYNGKQLIIKYPFKANTTHKLDVVWIATPQKAMYFIDWKNESGDFENLDHLKEQVWTQGQGKYTSNWLPSIDDMNDKIEFDLSITFDSDYKVIANGKLTDKLIGESTTMWRYDMQKPMSSYLVALAIGKYNKKVEYSKSGIPLEMYYYLEDSLKVEPTYRYTKHMFDFLEEEIGVPYPWQNYKQVPVKDFLYAGMENTGTTIFADSFLTDSIGFVDKNYVNVNAHELAHQWFGNLVTETSGTHHWLQEGFATYYALLAERDIFGDDYYYWRLYEYAQELLEQDKAGGSTSLLNPKSSSTTFYKKGAWVLHILRARVGDKAFKKAIKNYLKKHQFKNVETNDFIVEVEKASGENLGEFVDFWLKSESLNYDEIEKYFFPKSVLSSLGHASNVDFTYRYYPIDCNGHPEVCKTLLLVSKDEFLNEKIVEQLGSNISKSTFFNKSLKVRQAIAKNLSKIPLELKEDYESLLNDKSYITIEAALFNLWNNFPNDQNKYLSKTKEVVGFNDKNIRILWLTLALISDDFESENNERYFNELLDYTSNKYGFEVRMNAFSYLAWISSCDEKCQDNLKQATKHHNWRFSKFAKKLLKDISQ
ncbi:M1 family metallopeptidase [Sabulilitoribacter arenilitoris]|uniref:Aminopeptidase N n=1 Tax=Wocania arenilitoris TaxID=2044858 RepID=A0AAE3ESJ3_9FLAO|nr:M1 family metallopeptidase [Wocania arenilitoris]MCF7569459.1 M1 family metallopeptidase [Wocania arenilitoris]